MTLPYSELRLKKLALYVTLGWPDAERKAKQTVYLDMHLRFNQPPKACDSDELSDTICYNTLTDQLRLALLNKKFRLIENLTKTIYQILRQLLSTEIQINVSIQKFPDIDGLIDGVSFSFNEF